MKKSFIIFCFIFTSFCNLSAQLNIGKQNEEPIVPTWESYEFMKYGTIGASLYTGTYRQVR